MEGRTEEAVKAYVIPYFKEYGITITVLGLKEDISYENPAIQAAIDQKFASEQKVTIQENENEATLAKAEAEARAMVLKAEAEAEANRVLAESLSDAILKKAYYDKRNGVLPGVYGGDGNLLQIPIG